MKYNISLSSTVYSKYNFLKRNYLILILYSMNQRYFYKQIFDKQLFLKSKLTKVKRLVTKY